MNAADRPSASAASRRGGGSIRVSDDAAVVAADRSKRSVCTLCGRRPEFFDQRLRVAIMGHRELAEGLLVRNMSSRLLVAAVCFVVAAGSIVGCSGGRVPSPVSPDGNRPATVACATNSRTAEQRSAAATGSCGVPPRLAAEQLTVTTVTTAPPAATVTTTVRPPVTTVTRRAPATTVTKSVVTTTVLPPIRITVRITVDTTPMNETETVTHTETVIVSEGGSGSSSGNSDGSASNSGSGDGNDADGGYTGPRCYEPGGKVWHPCP